MTNTFKPGDVVTFARPGGSKYARVIHEGSDEAGYRVFSVYDGVGRINNAIASVAELKRITDD